MERARLGRSNVASAAILKLTESAQSSAHCCARVGRVSGDNMTHVPQPPVNPAKRALERHEVWPGLVAALAGVALAFIGARHLTSVDTVDGGTAWESQLTKAFSSAGVQYASEQPPPPPPNLEGLANPAEALDRWARQQANAQPLSWKIRVDLGAKAACPT